MTNAIKQVQVFVGFLSFWPASLLITNHTTLKFFFYNKQAMHSLVFFLYNPLYNFPYLLASASYDEALGTCYSDHVCCCEC